MILDDSVLFFVWTIYIINNNDLQTSTCKVGPNESTILYQYLGTYFYGSIFRFRLRLAGDGTRIRTNLGVSKLSYSPDLLRT